MSSPVQCTSPPDPSAVPDDATVLLERQASLFLDFDGTLVELADRPDAVIVDDDLRALLEALSQRLEGRLAIVSGRSIGQIDTLLGSSGLAVAGSHGAERRMIVTARAAPPRPPALDAAGAALADFASRHEGMLVEDKSLGAALHYRLAPAHEDAARRLAIAVADRHGLVVQHGKMMVEVRAPGDKGTAIRAMMAEAPFADGKPIFLGDDVTDEDGFVAVADLGGTGILVGPARETAATARLDSVAAVRHWLTASLERFA